MKQLILVACGGALGAVARWALSGWILHRTDSTFPLGTLTVNLVGCLLAGLLAGVVIRTANVPMDLQVFLMTGILGGFTTFSAFGVDTVYLLRRYEFAAALGYVLLSVVGGIVVLFGAMMLMLRAGTRNG